MRTLRNWAGGARQRGWVALVCLLLRAVGGQELVTSSVTGPHYDWRPALTYVQGGTASLADVEVADAALWQGLFVHGSAAAEIAAVPPALLALAARNLEFGCVTLAPLDLCYAFCARVRDVNAALIDGWDAYAPARWCALTYPEACPGIAGLAATMTAQASGGAPAVDVFATCAAGFLRVGSGATVFTPGSGCVGVPPGSITVVRGGAQTLLRCPLSTQGVRSVCPVRTAAGCAAPMQGSTTVCARCNGASAGGLPWGNDCTPAPWGARPWPVPGAAAVPVTALAFVAAFDYNAQPPTPVGAGQVVIGNIAAPVVGVVATSLYQTSTATTLTGAVPGQQPFLPCPLNTAQTTSGAVGAGGARLATSVCAACADNYWSPGGAQEACTPCPAGTARAPPVHVYLYGPDCVTPGASPSASPAVSSAPECAQAGLRFAPPQGTPGTVCEACPSGAGSAVGGYCVACPPGYGRVPEYAGFNVSVSGAAAVACVACTQVRGYWVPDGGGTCRTCPEGTTPVGIWAAPVPGTEYRGGSSGATPFWPSATETGGTQMQVRTGCVTPTPPAPCPPGYGYSAGMCVLCPPGTESALGAQCTLCPYGTHAPAPGTAACELCAPGTAPPPYNVDQSELAAGWSFERDVALSPNGTAPPGSVAHAGILALLARPAFVAHPNITTVNAAVMARTAHAAGCAACGPGTFSPAPWMPCTLCPLNTYANATGAAACTACPPGTSTLAQRGATACAPAGAALNATAAAGAVPCPPGTHTTRWASCALCPPHTYSAAEGAEACINCPVGTFSLALGATACTPCPVGTHGTAVGGRCAPCAPGSYAPTQGALECTVCPPGRAGLECTPCRPNTYAATTAAAVCTPCPPDTAAPDIGAMVCAPCPPGTRRPQTGPACAPCPAGSVPGGTGACTPCLLSQITVNGACVDCAYASLPNGTLSCIPRPADTALPAGRAPEAYALSSAALAAALTTALVLGVCCVIPLPHVRAAALRSSRIYD